VLSEPPPPLTAAVRGIGELASSRLKRNAFSKEDLLLDSGHAFIWPKLPKSKSVGVSAALVPRPLNAVPLPHHPNTFKFTLHARHARTHTHTHTHTRARAHTHTHIVHQVHVDLSELASLAESRPATPSVATGGPTGGGPPSFDDGVTLAQCMRAQRNFVGALLNIASKLVQCVVPSLSLSALTTTTHAHHHHFLVSPLVTHTLTHHHHHHHHYICHILHLSNITRRSDDRPTSQLI
jgi:hypothetical protein